MPPPSLVQYPLSWWAHSTSLNLLHASFNNLGLFPFTSAHTGYHAFQVSIQTGNSLPVIGEDFTLVCTFTPQTRNRLAIWERSGDPNTLASHNCQEHLSCRLTVIDQSKFSLLADYYSVNLTIKQLEQNDGDDYECTVSGTHVPSNTVSTSTLVTPLLPGKNVVFTCPNHYWKIYLFPQSCINRA